MDHLVEDVVQSTRAGAVEQFWESRERQRYPLCPEIFSGRDHVDAEPFVDPVRRPAPTPRHIQGDIATAAGGRVPVKALCPSRSIPGDNQQYPGESALQHTVEVHVEPAIVVGPAR